MSSRIKRLLIIFGVVIVILVLGYGLYALFLRQPTPSGQQPGQTGDRPGGTLQPGQTGDRPGVVQPGGQLPPSGQLGNQIPGPPDPVPENQQVSPVARGGITAIEPLTTTGARGAVLANNNAINHYDSTSGYFYHTTASGETTRLTDKQFFDVQKVTWSPNTSMAVLEYPDGANIIYNFETDAQVTLPTHWKNFSFAPSNSQLVFKSIGNSAENSWLAISQTDGSRARKIEHLGDKDATVYTSWSPTNQTVAMYSEAKSVGQQSLYFVGLNNENFKSVTLDGYNYEGQWSPDGKRLLYSVQSATTDNNPNLWIVSAYGESIGANKKDLNIQTWANKCTFASDTSMYCAVPRSLPQGAGLYPSQFSDTPSQIYRIDLETGFKSLVATPAQDHGINQLMVDQDERNLFFVSATDGRLYKIRLR